MSVTLRLQGLSYRTNSNDIRKFFVGLEIPQEGITITGGSKQEAIVDVATWDNAYQALQMSGLQIRDSTIQISVITSEEKQQALENSQKLVKDSENGRNGTSERKSNEGRDAHSRKKHYLRLNIGDTEATPEDVKHFFDGLHVSDLIFFQDKALPRNVIAITQFDSSTDATEGFNRYKDSKLLHVVRSCEKEWIKYGGTLNDEDEHFSSASGHSRRRTRSRSRRKRSKSAGRHSGSRRKHSKSPRRRSRSPRRRSRSPRKRSRTPKSSSRTTVSYSKSPASQSDEKDSIENQGYNLQLTNLSYRSQKEDLKKLFNLASDDQIVFVYDEKGHRTRTAFITFTSKEDFKKASKLNKTSFKGHVLFMSPISKSSMEEYLSKNVCPRAYVYLKNFFPKVTKNDVKNFLDRFNLHDDDIFLLFDKNNMSLGEAMVKFASIEEASQAERLNRKTFKDRRISLKRIYENRLVSFLQSNEMIMMSTDPNDCVTQEDDLPEEENKVATQDAQQETVTQGLDMCKPKEDPVIKEVKIPECVPQADDE